MYSKKCIFLVCCLLSLSTCLNFKCNWIWYAAWNCELLSVSPEYQGINVGNEIFSIWISTVAWFIGLLLCDHHQDESGNLKLKSRTNTQLFFQKNQELNHLNTLLHILNFCKKRELLQEVYGVKPQSFSSSGHSEIGWWKQWID